MRLALFSKECLRKISSYSSSVVVWMVAMLMISGLDLIIVGIFEYKATAYYAIAATLTNFVAQVQGAIFAAMLPASAALAARGDGARLGRLLVTSTRYGMLILLAMALPLIAAGHYILREWAGSDYAAHSTIILQVLVAANVIRLAALPYATLLLGTGQQNKVLISPLAEGVTNLAASIIGAHYFGAVGVALGTLAGSFVSLGSHLFYNMPRTKEILFSRGKLVRTGFLRPLICTLPCCLLFVTSAPMNGGVWRPYLSVSCGIAAVLLFWNYGLKNSEREKVFLAVRSSAASRKHAA
jgi:O-antigen/teichoic acid export membrane protein